MIYAINARGGYHEWASYAHPLLLEQRGTT